MRRTPGFEGPDQKDLALDENKELIKGLEKRRLLEVAMEIEAAMQKLGQTVEKGPAKDLETLDRFTKEAIKAKKLMFGEVPAGSEQEEETEEGIGRVVDLSQLPALESVVSKYLRESFSVIGKAVKQRGDFKEANLYMTKLYSICSGSPFNKGGDVSAAIEDMSLWVSEVSKKDPSYVGKFVEDNSPEIVNFAGNIDAIAKEAGEIGKKLGVMVEEEMLSLMEGLKLSGLDVSMEGGKYYTEGRGEVWQVLLAPPIVAERGESIFLVSRSAPEKFVAVNKKEFISSVEGGDIQGLMDRANHNFDNEKKHTRSLEEFDLPGEEKISYIRVFPKNYDKVISAALHGSAILAGVLERNYPNLEAKPVLFTSDPYEDLVEAIKNEYPLKKTFFLDFYAHGSETQLVYSRPLNAQDLVKISNEFPQAKFIVSTIACSGGGLKKGLDEEFKKDTDAASRFNVFLQVKPHRLNLVSRDLVLTILKASKSSSLGEKPAGEHSVGEEYSTAYFLSLIKTLNKGGSFGKAVRKADDKSKEHFLNPDSYLPGTGWISKKEDREKGGEFA